MSSRPNRSTVSSMSCLVSSHRETSVRWSTAFPPMTSTARTAACPAGSLKSAMTTCAPDLAKATAMAWPIPLPAPVTTPTLPSKLTIDLPPLQLAGHNPPLSHFRFSSAQISRHRVRWLRYLFPRYYTAHREAYSRKSREPAGLADRRLPAGQGFKPLKPFNSVAAHVKTRSPFCLDQTSLLGPGIGPGRMGKHRFDDLEARNVNGRVHVQEDSGVAEELLDAEVEHHAIAAVEFHGMLANLEDFLGGEYLDHVANLVGVRRSVPDGTRCLRREGAHGAELGRHVGEPQGDRLVLDQDAATLDIVLHIFGGSFERSHTNAQVL